MKDQYYIDQIYLYLEGELDPSQEQALFDWFELNPANKRHYDEIKAQRKLEERFLDDVTYDEGKALQHVLSSIDQVSPNSTQAKRRTLRPYILGIAASLVLLSTFYFVFFGNQVKNITAGVTTKVVTLKDGTVVWLQPGASLDQLKLTNDERNYRLTGQAYFDVASNPNRPFIIESADFSVKVLGTSFSLNTAPAASLPALILDEGIVQLSSQNDTAQLEAGQMAIFNQSKSTFDLTTSPYLNNSKSWQTSRLSFSNTSMQTVVKDLSRHYQIPITLDNVELKNCQLTGTFFNENLEGIMAHISNTTGLRGEKGKVGWVLYGDVCVPK